jgi:hypothetical protein
VSLDILEDDWCSRKAERSDHDGCEQKQSSERLRFDGTSLTADPLMPLSQKRAAGIVPLERPSQQPTTVYISG